MKQEVSKKNKQSQISKMARTPKIVEGRKNRTKDKEEEKLHEIYNKAE